MAIENLTLDTFKEKVYDFEASKEWNFKGKNPASLIFTQTGAGPVKS
jgi:thioredoxin 1